MTSSLIRHYYVIDNVMSHNELVNGIFLRPRSSWNIFFQRYLWTPVKNVTFLVLRNTCFLTIWEFFPNSHSKMFFNKIEIVVVSDWLQPCTGYIAFKKPFCPIFRIPTLRLLSSHWSTGLLIRSLIGPFDDNRSHDVRTFQYSPLLTRQSRLISDFITYYYCLPYIYIFCYFDGCGENIKYKDFALYNRQSVFGN